MTLHDTLSNIQRDLKAPKSNYNGFGKYNYRSCEDILEAVKKILPNGTHISLSDEIVFLGDRYYIKATATLTQAAGSISVYGYAREAEIQKGMNEAQITGSASSYARKYALNGLFAIDDTKDDDFNNKHDSKIPKVETAKKENAEAELNQSKSITDGLIESIKQAIESTDNNVVDFILDEIETFKADIKAKKIRITDSDIKRVGESVAELKAKKGIK